MQEKNTARHSLDITAGKRAGLRGEPGRAAAAIYQQEVAVTIAISLAVKHP